MLNHHEVHFKFLTMLYVTYTSKRQKFKTTKQTSQQTNKEINTHGLNIRLRKKRTVISFKTICDRKLRSDLVVRSESSSMRDG